MFPIDLNLGFKVFYYYEGFYFVIAILVAYLLAVGRVRRAGLAVRLFEDALAWVLLGAIVGARVSHFVFWDLQSVLADPMSFFRFWDGGLSITGGLAGGVLAAFLFFRRRHADFWAYFAAASPAILAGQAIGRVGCFLNGDAWGIPTALPWGVSEPKFGTLVPGFVRDHLAPSQAWVWSVSHGFTDPSATTTVPLHPTQLYEAVGDLLLAWLVIRLVRSLGGEDRSFAKVFWLHLGGYSFLRFALEFLHGDRDVTVWAGMTALQIGLVAFAALSGVLYLRVGRRGTLASG
ncbi:MAG: prolipoprotein diacylglyceryl transferase [Thermoanaerobaculaceae bacterium]|nr:prolipoprotein diacylglyceryl transferase [Thermoanaerobaculaceae bacterium]